jgi:hypothetical protein
LPQLLQTKHPETFGKMAAKSPGFENIMTTAINNSIAMSKAHSEKGEMASKTKKAMETFFDELMTKESARRPIFDPSTESFKEGPQFSLSEFPTKPEEVIDIVRAFFTKEFEFLANIWLKNNGAKLYGNILALHDMDKGEEEDEKEFNDALAKKAIEPTPAAPAAPAPPTPMAQPAPAPALAAAKPVEDLLGKAGDFNSPKQGLDLMNAILAKSDAIKADKSLAAKLDNAVKVIAQRWGQLQQFHKLTQEDWQLFSMAKRNLTKLIGEVS